jgi:hypothetical protein
MHENRETSRTSRTNQERDRSAKVRNYNADTHALEESDCAVVCAEQRVLLRRVEVPPALG